jgi:hypothetical protein
MIDRHWDGIAAYCRLENKVSLGFVEGRRRCSTTWSLPVGLLRATPNGLRRRFDDRWD